ncbi:hypothetical protein [Kocuria sp. HSID16901]|uniref:hypothetical protein n=1 Tax=Kocuria sp. HSID16901 TaxID=2419505 RepID=UPI00065F7E8C|nr:hypothetical protein [Kocuria sp. HSID16901]
MLVVVLAVLGMQVSVVEIIRVIPVLHALVSTVCTVLMIGDGVFSVTLRGRTMLVVVIAVESVEVPIMDVIGVIAMLDAFMPAIGAMLMIGNGVFGYGMMGAHGGLLQFIVLKGMGTGMGKESTDVTVGQAIRAALSGRREKLRRVSPLLPRPMTLKIANT